MAVQTMEPARGGTTTLASILGNTRKIGGVCGIFFVVLFIVCIIFQGDAPMFDDDIADIRKFWTDSSDTNQYLIFDWLIGIAFVFGFLPFLSALRTLIGSADPSGGLWARLTFAGGILFLIAGFAAGLAWGALALTQAEGLDDSTLRFAMATDAYAFATPIPAILLIPASLVIIATGVVWKWVGYLGLLAAILMFVSALWVVEGDSDGVLAFLGFPAFIGLGIWVLAISVSMLRQDAHIGAGA